MVDIATRVYNHTWKIDPIVRSVIDTDFYKLLMAQTIFRRHRNVQVTFGIKNRTTRVRLADIIDEGELREQLDHVRSLRLTRGESTWLRGTPSTTSGRCSRRSSWIGSKTSGFPNTCSNARTASTSSPSTEPGSRPRCGRSRRSRSSTSCARAAS